MQFKMKTKPYKHQKKEYEEHWQTLVRAIFWEQGCVDSETEYLSPKGWQKISLYKKGKVAQWHPDFREIEFVEPTAYIKRACKKMVSLKTKYGIDQLLSLEHRIPFVPRRHKNKIRIKSASEFNQIGLNAWYNLPANFYHTPSGNKGLGLTEAQLRVQIAVMADGSFPKHSPHTLSAGVNLKRPRKIKRLDRLLKEAGIPAKRKEKEDGFVNYYFKAPWRLKHYDSRFWQATKRELDIIADEVVHWDGSIRKTGLSFYSTSKKCVDFIQYTWASQGKIVGLSNDGRGCWQAYARTEGENLTVRGKDIKVQASTDGYKYCFEVPSTFLLFRRNGRIFPSGNTGKSKLIIDTACRLYLEGYVDTLIVIAPKGVHRNWVSDELPIHMWENIPYKALFWQGGYTKREQSQLAFLFAHTGLRFLTVNYQAVYDRKKPRSTKKILSKAKKILKDFLSDRTLFVLDESTAIKTPGSKTSRTVWALSDRCKRKRIMSGMPVTKWPLDVYAQFRILDRDILKYRTYAEFKQRYALVLKMDNYEIIKEFKNLAELRENYGPHMTRVLKKDCLDLPEKLPPIKRYFELTPKQNRHYAELAETFMTELDTPCEKCRGDRVNSAGNMCPQCSGTGTIINAHLAMVRRLRFQQICCGFIKDEDGTIHILCDPNPRVQLLRQCLNNLDSPGIIWACFHQDLTNICDLLKALKINYVEYSGRVNDDQKAEAKIAFQKEGTARILLASQASAYSGHTFHRAEFNIYYSQTDNGEHRWQSEDRSHRAGLKHPVSYIDFYSNQPIENAIMQNLLKKKAYNEKMMGDDLPTEGEEIITETLLSKEEMQSWVI